MALELLFNFSVIDKISLDSDFSVFKAFMNEDEEIILAYKNIRDKLIFTNKKIITCNVQGVTGKKKEFRMFPYSKISSYSVETAGFLDFDSDLRIWLSGVGMFEINFKAGLKIQEVGALLANKV